MTFENKGKEPVILLNPTLGFGTGIRTIISYVTETDRETGQKRDVEIEQRKAIRHAKESAILKSLIAFLDDDHPSENLTVILRPGDQFTFEEMFVAEVEGFVSFGNSKDYLDFRPPRGRIYTCSYEELIRCKAKVSHYRLVYEIGIPRSVIQDPDLLERLAHRWRRYGRLVIDENGAYAITSRPVKPH